MDRDREQDIKQKIIDCHNRFIDTHKQVMHGLLKDIGASSAKIECNKRPSANQNRIKQREHDERQVEEDEEESEQEKGKQEKSERKENNNHALQISTRPNLRANRHCLTRSKQLVKSEDRSRETKRKLQNNEADSEARKKKRVKDVHFLL